MLYHADVFMPELNLPKGTFPLTYSNHALRAAKDDRYGMIPLLTGINTEKAKVVEVETEGNKPVKILYRVFGNGDCDTLLAVRLPDWLVKTVWRNKKNDNHASLNTSRYCKGK